MATGGKYHAIFIAEECLTGCNDFKPTKGLYCVTGIMQYLKDKRGPWWRQQMETFSALLVICAGNSSVIGEFPAQRPVTRSFDVFFDLRVNKRWGKQWWGWWFETPLCRLWRHCNALPKLLMSLFPVSSCYQVSETMLQKMYDKEFRASYEDGFITVTS